MAEDFEGILKRALTDEFGVGVLCASREAADRVRQILYATRAKARARGVLDYDGLSVSVSPYTGDVLFVYKQKAPNGAG